jgi:hypothetical protein
LELKEGQKQFFPLLAMCEAPTSNLELEVMSRTFFSLLAITKLQAWILKLEVVLRIIIFALRHVQGSKHVTWSG